VILAQVNNEVGIIPDARDHSALSDAEFKSQVPAKLLAQLGSLGAEVDKVWHDAGSRREGTWAQVFGDTKQGEEVFSAWQLSRYLEAVAQAGKAEHNIPMFANAALIRPGYQPGQYPSAGPLPHLMEVWRIGAPSLDMISPDIYFPSFAEWGEKYKRGGNPLFIPEMSGTARVAGNAVYGVGHLGAMGLGPFAFENMAEDRRNDLSEAYRLMGGMCELILSARQKGQIIGLGPQIKIDWTDSAEPQSGRLGGVEFRATFDRQGGSGQVAPTSLPTIGSGRWEAPEGTALGAALIVQTGEEEFVVLGRGVVVTFAPASGTGKVGIDSVQEGEYVGGQWRGGRWLNGDETHQGRHIHLYDGRWSVQKVRLYRYE